MNTEEKIHKSALKLFVSKGFSCPTAAITRDAGVSNGILFSYFPSKNDLIVELYIQVRSEYFKDAMRLFSIQPSESDVFLSTLEHAWLHQIDWCLSNWTKFCYMRNFENNEHIYKLLEQNSEAGVVNSFLKKQIDQSMESGFSRQMDSVLMVDIGNAITYAVVRYLHAHPEKRKSKSFMDEAWVSYLSALRA